jgi:O-antigen ligase
VSAVVAGAGAAPVPPAERAYQFALSASLALLGFFLLFSTAGTSLALGLLLLLCCLPPARVLRLAPWRQPVMALGLLLLAYIGLRTFAADGLAPSLEAMKQYHELALLPILWALMRVSRRPQAFVNGLLLGAVLYATAHWLAPYVHLLEWPLHKRRVSAGFGLAICTFLLFENTRLGRLPPRIGYSLAAYLGATVVFASDGRTGHFLLLLLMICASFRASPPRLRAGVISATLLAALLMAYGSNPIRSRMMDTWKEIRAEESGAAAAPWTRTELLRTGMIVVREHWPLGTGWERYPQAYSDAAARRFGNTRQDGGAGSVNPHNEYVLQLGAGGWPALLLFVLWLAAPVCRAIRRRRKADPWAGAVGCLALAYAGSAAFNSVLLDFTEAHVYVALLAWMLARRAPD